MLPFMVQQPVAMPFAHLAVVCHESSIESPMAARASSNFRESGKQMQNFSLAHANYYQLHPLSSSSSSKLILKEPHTKRRRLFMTPVVNVEPPLELNGWAAIVIGRYNLADH